MRKRKKNRVMTLKMMIFGLLWVILFLSLEEDGFNPSSLKEQRRSS
jgi:hypothetical protein